MAPDSSSLSTGARALINDSDAGVITASVFNKYALGKLGYGYKVPNKYTDAAITAIDSMTLTHAINATWSEVPAANQSTITKDTRAYSYPDATSATTTLAVSGPCGPRYRIGSAVYNCSTSTAHFLLRWAMTGPTALPATNRVDSDGDGVPDFVATTGETLERAWATYSGLGYTAPTAVTVVINGLLSFGVGLALPPTFVTGPGNIQLPGDYDQRYLPAHELFHQFQYSYIHPRIPVLLPGGAALRLAALTKAVLNLDWWMEATAEWGSQKFAQANSTWTTTPLTVYLYARNVQHFMENPEYEIQRRDALAGGTRQYGEMVLPEFLEERFDTAFVRRVWENVAGDFLPDSTSDLADTATEYNTNIGDVLSDFWASLYKVCDTNHSPWDGTLTLSDPDVSSWCTRYINTDAALSSGAPGAGTFRLPHAVGSVASAGSATLTAGAGGARILDASSSTSSASRLVTVQAATDPNVGYFSVRVAQWNRSPGDRCDSDQLIKLGAGATTFSFITTPACPNVTLIATNTGYAGIDRTVNLSWSVQATAAVIGNGLIQLGVNAAGQLNAPGNVPSSGTGTTTVGLRYLPTGADSVAPGCLCEGWGIKIVDSDGNVAAGSANEDWGGARGLQLVSFTANATEATSVVKLGVYTVSHYFHPSPDNRLYQVDVNVSGGNILLPPTVTYRRVVDFDVEPTAFNEYISIHINDADLAQVLATANNGFNDPDPRTAASSRGATGSFTDYGPIDQGALFDLRIPTRDAFGFSGPSATLFYGAGMDSADAAAALSAVAAQTYAMAKPSNTVPPTGAPNAFVFGYRPVG